MLHRTITALFTFLLYVPLINAQEPLNGNAVTTVQTLTLQDCIDFAMKNQPAVNQAYIDKAIAHDNQAIAIGSWLPQVVGNANYVHYLQLPTSFLRTNGTLTPVKTGVNYTSLPQLTVNQNLFNNDALLAGRIAKLYMSAADENINTTKVNLVVDVSKAFYDVLLSTERINVYKEDTARLIKNQKDAYYRYQSGIADKVDYKQATISLNNALSQLKTANEQLAGKYAYLKQLLGAPAEQAIAVRFDTAQMLQNIYTDTLEALHIEKRPEYRTLEIMKDIQHQTTRYYRLGVVPSVSAFYNYNYQFQSNSNADLYSAAYPNSLLGVQLSVPIFSGLKRHNNVHKAQLQEDRVDWDEINLKLNINTQYQQALAGYKSNLYALRAQAENEAMAREVYNVVKLQYSEGIKAYLDVIIAESDLQTSEINYLNALFQVLESKLEFEKAKGDIAVP